MMKNDLSLIWCMEDGGRWPAVMVSMADCIVEPVAMCLRDTCRQVWKVEA